MHDIGRRLTSLAVVPAALALQACDPGPDAPEAPGSRIVLETFARVRVPALTEVSGLETAEGPHFLVHNDDGKPDIFVLDAGGRLASRYRLKGAKNRDWEDLTWLPHGESRLLAIGDIGDNHSRRNSIRIYFVKLPAPGTNAAAGKGPTPIEPYHEVKLSYPDGPRDSESLAYDPASGQILILTKRDKPPRLYGVDAGLALSESELGLEFLGAAPTFRPPTRRDMRRLGRNGAWVSQPTGMDINEDGTLAAVITYRSLYIFERLPDESWAQAFNRPPREFLGPRSDDEEAIAFGPDMQSLFISGEGHSAPIYRALLPTPGE